MLPHRNVVSLVDRHKSSRRRTASSSSSSVAGRSTMIKITRNPFFNFRTLVRHRVGAGRNAIAISTAAGREWSALDEQQKRPYRRLAHLSKMNGGPFFVRLEHLRTFLRYPQCVHDNEYFARIRTSGGAGRAAGTSGQKREQDAGRPSHEDSGVRCEAVSPQPDANFGGYEVATRYNN